MSLDLTLFKFLFAHYFQKNNPYIHRPIVKKLFFIFA